MALGDFISGRIRAMGLSASQFAARIGVHRNALVKIIAGTTKTPTLHTLQKVASGLGVDVQTLRSLSIDQGESELDDEPATCEICRIRGIDGLRGADFCAKVCQDFVFQPECKDLLCEPIDGSFDDCPHNGACPCSLPAPESRWQMFLKWCYAEYPSQYGKWKRYAQRRLYVLGQTGGGATGSSSGVSGRAVRSRTADQAQAAR